MDFLTTKVSLWVKEHDSMQGKKRRATKVGSVSQKLGSDKSHKIASR